jgi:hypothetical protein
VTRRASVAAARVVHAVLGHRLFAGLLVAAAALRVIAQYAYQPALFFYGDSLAYLANAAKLQPEPIRPAGYPAFLRAVLVVHDLAAVPAVQHVIGLATGVVVYALVRRLGAGSVLGCIAAVPVLFDAYQLNIEQHILSEALFSLLVVGALAMLLWRPRPTLAVCVGAGVILAAAALTRSVGLALVVPALVFTLFRGGAVRSVVLAAAFALPLAGYAAWNSTTPTGAFALTGRNGFFLYGRVAGFASCSRMHIRPAHRPALCDPRPPSQRPNPNYYVWHKWSQHRFPGFPRLQSRRNAILQSFALGVIRRQPGDYLRTVLGDMAHYAAFGRSTSALDESIGEWTFHVGNRLTHLQALRDGRETATWGGRLGGWIAGQRLLHGYQEVAYTPGPLLLAAVLLAVMGAVVGSAGRLHRDPRAETLTLAAAGVLIPLVAAMTSMFDYRYMLPSLPLLPPAGVLGAAVVMARWRDLRAASGDPVTRAG